MMKIKTEKQMFELLDNDFSWRLKEIADIKSSIPSASGTKEKVLIRAGVALLYAHWEGFIKTSSEYYLSFVSNRRLKYEQLKTCFIVFGIKKELNFIVESKKHEKNIKILEFIQNELSNRANFTYEGAINADSNLKSSVFETIATSIGINPTNYETKYNLIDESLLGRRNRIAHGEYLDISVNEFITLSNEVLSIMRNYKTDIENSIQLRLYIA